MNTNNGKNRITVREATLAEHAVIAGFQVAMAAETEDLALDRAVVERGVREVFRRPELGKYYVAVKDDRLVASLLITYEWSDWRNALVYWIQSVYVLPQERGRGVFRAMYGHIRDLVLTDEAVSGIRLYVDKNNRTAREVYRRLQMDGDHYALYEWMK